MRCNICDKQLTDKEIVWNKDYGTWEPCSFCLEAALDAAYTNGFQDQDDDSMILVGEESDDDRVEFVSFRDYKPLGGVQLDGDD